MASPEPDLDALARGVSVGDRASVAQALNLVEDRRGASRERVALLLARLGDGRAAGHRIGLTGPPGVGKSTLAGALARTIRARGHTVGIVAVDPSSRRSGGALLGDRARIETDPEDPGFFVRSLATAGELGGLARAVPAAVLVLAAAFDTVLVETVGVGQSETDVEHVVDTVVFVIQPASGDALQFLKAGIMEIPDVLAINKSDLGTAARRARADVRGVLHAVTAADWEPPVVLTSATRREGLEELLAALAAHREHLVVRSDLDARRWRGRVAWGVREHLRRHGEIAVEREGGLSALRVRVERALREGRALVE